MSYESRRSAVVDGRIDVLRGEGYEVIREPSADVLPGFLGKYRPDFVALKEGKNLAIDVVSMRQTKTKEELKESNNRVVDLFKNQPDWTYEVFWISPDGDRSIDTMTLNVLAERIAELEKVFEISASSAVLLLWAIVEAVARMLHPDQLRVSYSPATVIETLASAGNITPDQGDILREFSLVRNKIAHGDLRVSYDHKKLLGIVRIMNEILSDCMRDVNPTRSL